jgi:integrase
MAAVARDRVASAAEFARLLSALKLRDGLPFALAGYATARHQEVRTLDWAHVHLELGAIELAGDERGRKPGGSWRIVPLVAPLRSLLRRAWLEQGRPSSGKVCPPRKQSKSGLLALDHLQERVPSAGGGSVSIRSACTRRGTLRRRGSTTPVSRRRSPRS